MPSQVMSALVAVLLGAAIGFFLFVPLVAISYRRRGRLSLPRLAFWGISLVYFLAIWTYTLLPIPASDDYACAPAVLSLAPTLDDLTGALGGDNPLRDPRLLQVALNVLLFVPLGFLVRVVGRRGVLVALGVGIVLSLLIELTQFSGVWGVFPCAYRLFDVGDLATNTLGAVAGSIVGLLVPARLRGLRRDPDASQARPVTRGRRLVAIVCDIVGAVVIAGTVSVAVQLFLDVVVMRRDLVVAGDIAQAASAWATAAVWLLVTLATGRSVGDMAVELRYDGGTLPEWFARTLRFTGGVGGYIAVSHVPVVGQTLAGALALAALVLFFTTRAGRGLPGVLSRRYLVDTRSAPVDEH